MVGAFRSAGSETKTLPHCLTPLARSRATREDFPGEGPVEIAEAYKELSRPAFAFWLRMHVASPEEITMGRKKLARVLRTSVRNMSKWMLELKRKGYVDSSRKRPKPERFAILRRAVVRNGQEFQRY